MKEGERESHPGSSLVFSLFLCASLFSHLSIAHPALVHLLIIVFALTQPMVLPPWPSSPLCHLALSSSPNALIHFALVSITRSRFHHLHQFLLCHTLVHSTSSSSHSSSCKLSCAPPVPVHPLAPTHTVGLIQASKSHLLVTITLLHQLVGKGVYSVNRH